MNITYTRNGDYLIPNIIIRKTKPIGHYGRLRKAYLEMHRPILFNELVRSDTPISFSPSLISFAPPVLVVMDESEKSHLEHASFAPDVYKRQK